MLGESTEGFQDHFRQCNLEHQKRIDANCVRIRREPIYLAGHNVDKGRTPVDWKQYGY